MDTEQKGSSAPSSESSAPDVNPTDSGQTQELQNEGGNPPAQKVDADLQRIKDDMLKYKKENQEYKRMIESLKQQKLKEQNDYKTLYEQSNAELEKFRVGYVTEKKREALKSAALKLGLRPEAEQDLELLGLDQIHEEFTSDGRIIVHGAEQLAEEMKKRRSHWFKSGEAPKFYSGGGSKAEIPQELTPQYMRSLETSKDQNDRKKYKELYPKFVEQLRKKRMG